MNEIHCPQCGGRMVQKSQDTHPENGKIWDRTVFQCYSEDVWVTVEIAQKEEKE